MERAAVFLDIDVDGLAFILQKLLASDDDLWPRGLLRAKVEKPAII